MLVLSRKAGERIQIGAEVTVEVRKISGGRVALAFSAPEDVHILRSELKPFFDKSDSFHNPSEGFGCEESAFMDSRMTVR